MPSMPPLILTCMLNQEAFAFFNTLRKQHFPSERNFLDAHLTLFHHLPPEEPAIISGIRELCTRGQVIDLEVREVVFTGRGVAYRMESPALKQLHHSLQQRWKQWLTLQDKQGLWPHVTVQNKADPATARLLQKQLAAEFTPFKATAEGLQLWEYLEGPWALKESFTFQGTGNG